ncbi:MAG: hypothetical protein ABIK09_16990 [Pseudomonadota bacterium]
MHIVRLIGATLGALVCGAYVAVFNGLNTALLLSCDFSDDRLAVLPIVTRLCVRLDLAWFVVPVAVLVLGIVARRGQRRTAFETVIASGWLLSLAWVLVAHLVWTLPMLPLCAPVSP